MRVLGAFASPTIGIGDLGVQPLRVYFPQHRNAGGCYFLDVTRLIVAVLAAKLPSPE